MHKTVCETKKTLAELKSLCPRSDDLIAVAPPFTALSSALAALNGSPIELAAQNCHFEEKGAFTGEISPVMLKELGVRYVILGHSERRQLFGETDELISKKVKKVMELGLVPVLCIGETKAQRDSGRTFSVLETQLKGSLQGITQGGFVIAYEPVWAIGTGDTATPKTAEEAHAFTRNKIGEIYDKGLAQNTIIMYGGSVKPDNARELMAEKDIDGALVGGASLDARSFGKIFGYMKD